MVRSESADEEVVIDKYDDLEEEDFSPQSRWTTHNGNGMPNRPDSRTASSLSPTSNDPDRRLRRQIANCNERRRMQSINAGFQSLRALLPKKEGEKLSKAAILQQTADLIHQMQSERQHMEHEGAGGKKAKMDCCSEYAEIDHRSMVDQLQSALERERANRMFLEQQLTQLREQVIYQQQSASLRPASPQPQQLMGMMPVPAAQSMAAQVAGMSPATPMCVDTPPMAKHEASVIRPTPLPPISIDVSSRVSSSASVPLTSSPLPLPPMGAGVLSLPSATSMAAAMTTTPSAFTNSTLSAHRSLQTILDAIRHLEGGAMATQSPPPPSSQAPLVR